MFFALILAVQTCALYLFLATDVFLFYVFFEVILVPMYFLIGGFGPGSRRTYAAAKFLIFGLLGGFVMLASVIGLYVQSSRAGQPSYLLSTLSQLGHCDRHRPLAVRRLHVCVRDQGPLVPLHTWLPDAAEESTAGSATMMVGVMDKIGTFGMIRFCLGLFPEASQWATPVVLVLATISILYGAILAIGSRDIMRFIAYTVDQPLRLHRARHLCIYQPESDWVDALHAQPRDVDGRALRHGRISDQATRLARHHCVRRSGSGGTRAGTACCCSPGCPHCHCRACPASSRSSWCLRAPSAGIPRTRWFRRSPSCWLRCTS